MYLPVSTGLAPTCVSGVYGSKGSTAREHLQALIRGRPAYRGALNLESKLIYHSLAMYALGSAHPLPCQLLCLPQAGIANLHATCKTTKHYCLMSLPMQAVAAMQEKAFFGSTQGMPPVHLQRIPARFAIEWGLRLDSVHATAGQSS